MNDSERARSDPRPDSAEPSAQFSLHPRAVAIVQARMGSRRLPGKVLSPFGRRSMLAYLIARLDLAHTIREVVVATSTDLRDDAIVTECRKLGVAVFRGSENDVLGRYAGAARDCGADIVVRVTADNPFTDPGSIDRVVTALNGNLRYALEDGLPVGTTGEALTSELLFHLADVADRDDWREHVTLYAKQHLSLVGGRLLRPPSGLEHPRIRLTVDDLIDYLWAQEVRAQVETAAGSAFDLRTLIGVASRLSAAA